MIYCTWTCTRFDFNMVVKLLNGFARFVWWILLLNIVCLLSSIVNISYNFFVSVWYAPKHLKCMHTTRCFSDQLKETEENFLYMMQGLMILVGLKYLSNLVLFYFWHVYVECLLKKCMGLNQTTPACATWFLFLLSETHLFQTNLRKINVYLLLILNWISRRDLEMWSIDKDQNTVYAVYKPCIYNWSTS